MKSNRNASSISSVGIVWVFLLAAAALSAHDIVTLFERIGAPAPLSWLAPVFIDGVAWLGKLMRSHNLSAKTNRTGLIYLVLGGSASLAANLAAGESLGMKLLGLLAVTGFILGEIALDKIEGRAAEKTSTNRPAHIVTQAEKDARKAAGYLKMSPQAKAKWTMKYRARMAKQAATVGATTP